MYECKYEFLIRNRKQNESLMPTVAYMQHDLKLKVLNDVLSPYFFPYFYQILDIVNNRIKKKLEKNKNLGIEGLIVK